MENGIAHRAELWPGTLNEQRALGAESVFGHGRNATPTSRSVRVNEHGNIAESHDGAHDIGGLTIEIQRLRRAGLPDLALRARRYPIMTALFASKRDSVPTALLARLVFNAQLFTEALAQLPSEQLRQAAVVLFHVGISGTSPPLKQRRLIADRLYTGHGHAREPDTIQRYLERELLDPLLVEALSTLPAQAMNVERVPTEEWNDGTREDDLDQLDDMNRREFLHSLSLASAFAVAPPIGDGLDWDRLNAVASQGRRLDPATVNEYAALNSELWRTFASSSRTSGIRPKHLVLPLVRQQLDTLNDSLQRPHGLETHRQLCALLGDLLQLGGEIFFDANRYTEAAHCYALAAAACKEADAFDLWACATTRHAFIGVYERQFRRVLPMLDLADNLARRGDSSRSTRHWVQAVKAQALAGLGDLGECRRAIESAEQVKHLTGVIHNGGWLRFDGARLAEERGACYVELSRPDLAAPALLEALGSPLSGRRHGGVLTDLATVGAQRNDREQLDVYGTQALAIARQTGSGVVAKKLQGLRTHLTPFLHDGRIRDLDMQITTLSTSHPTT